MNPTLFFDFTVDKANNSIVVTREFAAGIDLVWEAWTNPEILDQWWAPKPYKTITKSMDFRVGGCWLYSMNGPNGEVHWCRADYQAIEKPLHYRGLDAFTDENGVVNESFPRSQWDVTFTAKGERTSVLIKTTYAKLEDLEMIIQMGFKEGFTMALGNLDQYFESLS